MVFGGGSSGGLELYNRKDKNLFEPKGASLLGVKLLCITIHRIVFFVGEVTFTDNRDIEGKEGLKLMVSQLWLEEPSVMMEMSRILCEYSSSDN